MNLSNLLSTTAVVLAVGLFASPASAQTGDLVTSTPDSQAGRNVDVDPDAGPADEIIVTGSRIARPNLESANPIQTVTIQELTNTGNVSLGDALNTLPALGATFSSANSTRFIGTVGLSLLDLRRLGTTRTLVLVNNRRHVTSSIGSFDVDVNTIPVDLVDRVDIVTGGTSAVYGSDAVAGVVNFVTKRDFEGVRLRAQGGISDRGDRGAYFVSGTAGKNFADGRGNIAVNGEYSFSDVLFFTDRDRQTGAYSGRTQFNAVQYTGPITNPSLGLRPAEPSTGDGIPDQALLNRIRNTGISEGGFLTSITCPVAAAAGESQAAFDARRAIACTNIVVPNNANPQARYATGWAFAPDGTLLRNNCDADLRFTVASQNCVGGLGSTLRLNGMLQPKVERYAANILAHYEVSPAFRPFVEAKYVRINAVQEGQPTFYNTTFSINNPYLSQQARDQIIALLPPGATSFSAQRFNVDFGGRGEDHRRETYRIVGGVDGVFNGDWRYEVALNYGRTETFYRGVGGVLEQRFFNSRNAVRNAAGQIVCAINADASTANDDPSCVPVNLFGFGNVSQAALDYFGYDSTREEWAEQLNATAFISGDLSQLFSLPGGDIGFVIGGEYRRERQFAAYDELTATGQTFLNAIPEFSPPTYEVKEVFGELRVPLLADLPFVHELSLEGAGRYSHYNIDNVDGVVTWNAGGVYAPFRDLRLRGGWGRSVRAPTPGNLFQAPTQTFVSISDPCSQTNINNNPFRAANCAAAGVPTTQTFNGITEPFTNVSTITHQGQSTGNDLLQEERSNSFTAGAVFQPDFAPGLTVSVDYYNVRISNAIFSLGGQTVVDQCYDNPSGIDNVFCAAVFRNANGTFVGQPNVVVGGAPIDLDETGPSFLSQPFNFARQEASGVDADINYTTNLGGETRLNLRGVVTYVIKRNNFTDVAQPDFRTRQLSQVGDPQWRFQLTSNIDFGVLDLNYQLQYVGKQTIGAWETQNSFDGRPPQNPDAFPQIYYPEVFYHNIRVGLDLNDRFRFYTGVDNVTDVLPPFGQLGTEAGSLWTNTGRFFYAGIETRF